MVSTISFWIRNPTQLSNRCSESLVSLFRKSQPYLANFSGSLRRSILPLSPSLLALAVGVSVIAVACLLRRYYFQKKPGGGSPPPDVSDTSAPPLPRRVSFSSDLPRTAAPATLPVIRSQLPSSPTTTAPAAHSVVHSQPLTSLIARVAPPVIASLPSSSTTAPAALQVAKWQPPRPPLRIYLPPEVWVRLSAASSRIRPLSGERVILTPENLRRLLSVASELGGLIERRLPHQPRRRPRLEAAAPGVVLPRAVLPLEELSLPVDRVQEIPDSAERQADEWVLLEAGQTVDPPLKPTLRNLLSQMRETAERITANIKDKRPKITFVATNDRQQTFFTRHPNFFEHYPFEHVVSVLCRLGGDVTTQTLQEVTGVFGINAIWDYTAETRREDWNPLPSLETGQSLMVPVILQKNILGGHFVDHIILLSVFPGAPGVIRYYDSQGIPLKDRLRNTSVRSRPRDPVSLRAVVARIQATYPGYLTEEKLTPKQPTYSVTCGLFVLREMLRRALPAPITARLGEINPVRNEEAVRREIFSIFLDRFLHNRSSRRVVEVV